MRSLLPPNASELERQIEQTTARIGDVDVPIDKLMNPDECPLQVLPFLAWALSVDYWNPDWPEQVQRDVIRSALKVHRYKGTPGAVEDGLAAAHLQAVVEEWFDYNGTPGHFRVTATLKDRGLTADEVAGAMAIVRNAKNKRSHLDSLNVRLGLDCKAPRIGVVVAIGVRTKIYPPTSKTFDATVKAASIGIGLQIVSKVTIQGAD